MYNGCSDMTCLSMQMWVFEVIPFLGSVNASRLEGTRFSCLFNWGYKKGIPSLKKIIATSMDENVHTYLSNKKTSQIFILNFERAIT